MSCRMLPVAMQAADYVKKRVMLAPDLQVRHDTPGKVICVERRGSDDYLVVRWDSGSTSKRLPHELILII